MGLIVNVYRAAGYGDCTNGGLSSRFDELCLVNADGPFEPSEKCPAVIMESHYKGCLRIVPVILQSPPSGEGIAIWAVDKTKWYMAGGNYAATSDSRFNELAAKLLGHTFYAAVKIHDRVE